MVTKRSAAVLALAFGTMLALAETSMSNQCLGAWAFVVFFLTLIAL